MTRTLRCSVRVCSLAGVIMLANCTDQSVPADFVAPDNTIRMTTVEGADHHIVVFTDERVPPGFVEHVSQLGGLVDVSLDNIGVAAVSGLSEPGVSALLADPGIRAIEREVTFSLSDRSIESDEPFSELSAESVAPADATSSPTSARFYSRQWNLRAVLAPDAWAAGHLGSRNVAVAILDSGIDYLHPDLVGLVDLERSTSFVPEEDAEVARRFPGRLPFTDLFWHGTAVASVVASNATVLAGVNRNVTLIAVKIADSTNASSLSRFLSGIVYAADHGADVINMSIGRERSKSANPGIVAAFDRATNYAFRKGALIVSVPFNDAADLDHNGDLVRLPCESAHVICVSATGPTAAAGVNGPWENVDAPAPYTAFGQSSIDVAAPGGTGMPAPNRRVWVPCTTTWSATTEPPACRLPVCRLGGCIAQGQGTSFAAPTVAGLAALLVAQVGHGNPALVRARMLQSADDLGAPGTDPYYGKGRINIARALGVIP